MDEARPRFDEGTALVLRIEGFNILNHGNYLGRGQTVYGDTAIPNPTFGQLVAVGNATNAIRPYEPIESGAAIGPAKIRRAGARIRYVEPIRHSLEDVYLRLLGDAGK